jgi:hypothetical protein
VAYSVPRIYAKQSPQWTIYAKQSPQWTIPSVSWADSSSQFDTQTIKLHDVDEDIGHTLVHYLYTGTYQTLKLEGISDLSDSETEYRRAGLVYCTARLYGLDRLAEHAMQNMELFEKDLSAFQVLDTARELYPKLPADEIWFPEHLKAKIETAFEADQTIFTQDQFLSRIGNAATFTRALVKMIAEIYNEKITIIAKKEGK